MNAIKRSIDRVAYKNQDPLFEAEAECDNAQTVGWWPAHPQSNAVYRSVTTIQEETASMNWRIASDRSGHATWTLDCLSIDNALRG